MEMAKTTAFRHLAMNKPGTELFSVSLEKFRCWNFSRCPQPRIRADFRCELC